MSWNHWCSITPKLTPSAKTLAGTALGISDFIPQKELEGVQRALSHMLIPLPRVEMTNCDANR